MREGVDGVGRRAVLAFAGAAGGVAVAGCAVPSNSGPAVEVTENAFEGAVELSGHEVGEEEIANVTAVVVTGRATNTAADRLTAAFDARFYDDDGRFLGRDGPAFAGVEIPPGSSYRYDKVFQGRLADVARVELRVVEPDLLSRRVRSGPARGPLALPASE